MEAGARIGEGWSSWGWLGIFLALSVSKAFSCGPLYALGWQLSCVSLKADCLHGGWSFWYILVSEVTAALPFKTLALEVTHHHFHHPLPYKWWLVFWLWIIYLLHNNITGLPAENSMHLASSQFFVSEKFGHGLARSPASWSLMLYSKGTGQGFSLTGGSTEEGSTFQFLCLLTAVHFQWRTWGFSFCFFPS